MDPDVLGRREFYALLNSVVVPRPIAWVSSRSADGVLNLAPHSFFTVSCVQPPMVQFTSVGRKDSLNNVEATGEFVVNFAAEPLYEQVNATGTNFPPDVSEFEAIGADTPSRRRRSPYRGSRSRRWRSNAPCTPPSNSATRTVVIGRVRHLAIDAAVMAGDHPEIQLLRPLARLGKDEWSTIGEVRSITRIRHSDWPGHFTPPSS